MHYLVLSEGTACRDVIEQGDLKMGTGKQGNLNVRFKPIENLVKTKHLLVQE